MVNHQSIFPARSEPSCPGAVQCTETADGLTVVRGPSHGGQTTNHPKPGEHCKKDGDWMFTRGTGYPSYHMHQTRLVSIFTPVFVSIPKNRNSCG